jgi:hypothetical protein
MFTLFIYMIPAHNKVGNIEYFFLKLKLKPDSWTYDFVEVSGHILRVLKLEVSVYNVSTANQFCWGGGSKIC